MKQLALKHAHTYQHSNTQTYTLYSSHTHTHCLKAISTYMKRYIKTSITVAIKYYLINQNGMDSDSE